MRRLFSRTAAALALTLLLPLAAAHGYKVGSIDIGHPWARATVPGQQVGGAYLKLSNTGAAADRLLSASAPGAERVELHSMTMQGDVMRMQQVDTITLVPGQSVELKPGGYHLMLVGLKEPLKAGSKVPLTLKFEKAGEVRVDLAVEAAAGAAAGHKH